MVGEREVPLYEADQEQLRRDLITVSRQKLSEQITAGLSFPGKMDCPSWGIPVEECKTGAKLAQRAGTVCESCYAAKGSFRFQGTLLKLRKAFEGIFNPLWTPAMIQQIAWHCEDRFRWFHAGDLNSVNHLRNIIRVCLETPWVMHWLPTRESKFVLACKNDIPDNLTIRASSNVIDGPLPKWWPVTSSVVTEKDGPVCPSSHGCNACWDREVANVPYLLH